MSAPSEIAERLRKLRARLGLSQEQLAVHLGYTRSYLSQLESGAKEPGPRFVERVAQCERESVPTEGSRSRPYSLKEESIFPGRLEGVRMIPLISSAQAGFATTFEEIPVDWQDWVPAAVKDEKAFAIQIRGDSMEPKFQDGDVAVLLPNTPPRNGDLVVAKIKEEGFAFKIMNLVGGDPDRIRLTSYNKAYEPMDFGRANLHWIYPVQSVIKTVRR